MTHKILNSALALAFLGTAFFAWEAKVAEAKQVSDEIESCTCSSCSPGSMDCVYIICEDPSQSGMCHGKYNDT